MTQDSSLATCRSCLQSPNHHEGWSEIYHLYPQIRDLLIPLASDNRDASDLLLADPILENLNVLPSALPIRWSSGNQSSGDLPAFTHLRLTAFDYDCGATSPYVSNVYRREWSHDGWYRWVGPLPELRLLLPIDVYAHPWKLTIVIHAFACEENCHNLRLVVLGKQFPLVWLEGTTYTCEFKPADLVKAEQSSIKTTSSLADIIIAAPPSVSPSDQDERLISFAIRKLTLTPHC